MTVRNSVLAATMLAAGVAGAVSAPDSATEAMWRAACKHDAFVHCALPALAADRARVRDCLIRKLYKLSEPCRTVIRTAQTQAALRSGSQPH